ncbi:hypothetical protein GmHk_06G016797 [Glycine max]|nr:hypothetical protein GmHk_06G016797 [Glycine max]
MSLLVDGLTKVTMDKWMDITNMRYVIASRYNVILVSLSQQQSMMFFPLRSQQPVDSSVHRIICIGHVYGNHFVQVYLKDHCPLPHVALLCSSNCHPQAKTTNGILNLLEAIMTRTHDALLYYNGRWNMPRQNEFVGYLFTGKNPKKF